MVSTSKYNSFYKTQNETPHRDELNTNRDRVYMVDEVDKQVIDKMMQKSQLEAHFNTNP